jgi:predicted dehydrogenase
VSNQAKEQVVGEPSPKRRLRLGLVGCGEVTQIMHWPSLYQLSDHFEVGAVRREPIDLRGTGKALECRNPDNESPGLDGAQ